MKRELTTYIRAGYSCVFIRSHEDTRVEAEVLKIAADLGFSVFTWDLVNGITNVENAETIGDTKSPLDMLAYMDGSMPDKSILLAKDLHPYLGDGTPAEPIVVAALKQTIRKAAPKNKVLIPTGCAMAVPKEIERMCAAIEFELPDRATLGSVLDGVLKSTGLTLSDTDRAAVLDAARGLTTTEAENAFALSIVNRRTIVPSEVADEKVKAVRKSGLLQIEAKQVPITDIGGLDLLKQYLGRKARSFSQEAREYGLPAPRGVLVVGQPGTGKSLTSKAAASIYGIPLLSLEAGRLFDSLVGGTEGNWRSVFALAKGCSPCVLRIDEIDGLFSGAESSGKTDGGTTARVLKSILQDMQENSEGIFYFFTANDVDKLPDPLLSRVDVFYVDLPTKEERQEIWRIHISKERGPVKKKRDAKKLKLDLEDLAELTEDYSGREIEQIWISAMERAFIDGGRDPVMQDIEDELALIVPVARMTKDVVDARRNRLKGKARPASSSTATVATSNQRRILA